LFRLQIRSSR